MDFKDYQQEGHRRNIVLQDSGSSLPQRAHRSRKDKIRNRQTLPAGTDCRSSQIRRHRTENRKRSHHCLTLALSWRVSVLLSIRGNIVNVSWSAGVLRSAEDSSSSSGASSGPSSPE